MGSYRDLEIWQLSRELVLKIYRITELLPLSEKFGIKAQLRRAAVSIPANIAEGAGRKSDGSSSYSLRVALGSAFESETLLTLMDDLGLVDRQEIQLILNDLRKVTIKIQNLIASLQTTVVREEARRYDVILSEALPLLDS